MSEFTFNLNGLNISEGGGLPTLPAGLSNLSTSLYSSTKDSDLTYTGSDYIVWDRINAERLRRGLPGLADIGYPRPPEDSTLPASAPASSPETSGTETFKIKGPPGMTLDQARAIFEQQVKTGGVTGFVPGDTLSAVTQAFDGLEAAKAQFGQSLGKLSGNLPPGTNLQTLATSLGPDGAAAFGQISSFATGTAAAINSMRVNASGFASSPEALGALNQAIGMLPSVPSQLNAALTREGADISNDIKSFAGELNGVVGSAVSTISNVLKGTPTDGIGVADLSKAVTALGPLPGLDQNQVTASIAQAQKLAGQKFDQMTSAAGIGAFGFDASQLEKAGLVKPGTAAEFLAQGQNDLIAVLKSPTVWTGKDGIKKVQDVLGNPELQSKIQQGLMKDGLGDLKQLGVPTEKMTPQALSGLATNAAKSVQDAFKWTQNAPDLSANIKAAFDKAAVNSAFAVNLVENKVEAPVLKEKVVEPSENTVNSATVDAAAARVVGNDKVPSVTPTSNSTAEITVLAYIDLLNNANASFDALSARLAPLTQQAQISQTDWTIVNDEYIAIKATFNSKNAALATTAGDAIRTLSQSDPNYVRLVNLYNGLPKLLSLLKAQSETIKQIIASLANKITT